MGLKGGLWASALLARRNRHLGGQFIRALVTGVIATGVDLLVMASLVAGLNWHYLAGNAVSYTFGSVINYSLSVYWVFSARNISNRMVEFCLFVSLGVIGLGVSQLSMLVFVEAIGMHYLAAKIAATGCHFGFNFATRKCVLFRDCAVENRR